MREITITPAEIREMWEKIQTCDRNPFKLNHDYSWWTGFPRGDYYDSWVGASGNQILDRLKNGYYSDSELDVNLAQGEAEIDTPMIDLFEEDGDLLIDQVLNGEDLCYARWENFEVKRGMTIRALWDFNADTPERVIHAYTDWLLRIIDQAQAQGIAPDVVLVVGVQDTYKEYREKARIFIPLVKAGDVIDTVAWRAYFHGSAFRTLGFVALLLAGDKWGFHSTYDLGFGIGSQWDVTMTDDDVLEIECPSDASSFPEEEMTAKLNSVMEGR